MSDVLLALSVVMTIVAAIFLLPTLSDLVSLVWPSTPNPAPAPSTLGLPRFLVLIPAHDEELLIDACLQSLAAVQYPADRLDLLVVADNCSDSTATRVRQHGVRCLERQDSARRGKPWAIAWALEQIIPAHYDTIMVLDADSLVDPALFQALGDHRPLADKIVQGYIDISNPGDSAITRMARVWSAVRFLGINGTKARAALNVPLGDGVCIGTTVLARYGWHAFSLSETWELYASMTAAGVRCVCAPNARLFAQEARSLKQSSSQRRRWTAGRLSVLAKYGPALIRSRHIGLHQKLDCLGELMALGPAAQVGVAVPLAALAILLHLPGALAIASALIVSIGRPAAYTVAAVAHDPEPGAAVSAFAYLPIYIAWRLGIQVASFITLGRAQWLRTSRHAANEPQ